MRQEGNPGLTVTVLWAEDSGMQSGLSPPAGTGDIFCYTEGGSSSL